jgi:hypothetical protein
MDEPHQLRGAYQAFIHELNETRGVVAAPIGSVYVRLDAQSETAARDALEVSLLFRLIHFVDPNATLIPRYGNAARYAILVYRQRCYAIPR